MIEKSPAPKRASAAKKSSPKKRASSRAGKSKAKKPKVVLAKNKVAMLCGLICGICVLAIALSVVSNSEKPSQPHIAEVKKEEPKKITQVQKAEQKSEPVKSQKSEAAKTESSLQKSNIIEEKRNQEAQKSVQTSESPKIQKTESAKTESTQKTAKKPESSPNVKVVTKEMKSSSAVKTIPQNQNSTAGVATTKTTQTQNLQKSSQSSVTSQNTVKPSTSTTQKATSAKSSQNMQTASQNTTKPNANSQIASAKTPRESETIQQNIPKNRFDIPPASNGATIVIIIDDAGRSVENTKRYANLPFPITIAVLPKLPQSRACADAIRAAGKEVILHQPMQSLNHNLDPGPGKITTEMTTYEIARIVKENLSELGPGVRGLNNHEGSDVTSNEIKIGAVLDVCDEMGVYFLDSRTTAATKAPQAALERDMHIFEKAGPYLDNDIDRAKMLERMRETLAYANRHGRAIVIGHVDKSVKILPDLLAEMYPEMKAAGYRFATPSMLR